MTIGDELIDQLDRPTLCAACGHRLVPGEDHAHWSADWAGWVHDHHDEERPRVRPPRLRREREHPVNDTLVTLALTPEDYEAVVGIVMDDWQPDPPERESLAERLATRGEPIAERAVGPITVTATLTSEGVVIDAFSEDGPVSTFTRTYDEMGMTAWMD